mmetsp:Transcript_3094/g.5321  ORF Transcript_3094/g.5321 Transcript_3094/m.5321 type:complete len:169 (+) Transcript_3094:169-675(+)
MVTLYNTLEDIQQHLNSMGFNYGQLYGQLLFDAPNSVRSSVELGNATVGQLIEAGITSPFHASNVKTQCSATAAGAGTGAAPGTQGQGQVGQDTGWLDQGRNQVGAQQEITPFVACYMESLEQERENTEVLPVPRLALTSPQRPLYNGRSMQQHVAVACYTECGPLHP